MPKIILGLTGEIASGKGTAAKYIIGKYQAGSHRFSTMLRDVLDRLYLPQSRENMQLISLALRQNFGEDILARVMAEEVKNDISEVVAIDGVRRLADIKYLRELPEFKLVYIETDMKKCYERIVGRGENPDEKRKTFEEFQKDHEQDAELQIKDLKNSADFVIDNNGALEELYRQVEKVIKKI